MDRRQFAERVDRLLTNKALGRELGTRGRQLLRDKFNFDQYISDLEEMFERITTQSATREIVTAS
jgi:hypothetical protein